MTASNLQSEAESPRWGDSLIQEFRGSGGRGAFAQAGRHQMSALPHPVVMQLHSARSPECAGRWCGDSGARGSPCDPARAGGGLYRRRAAARTFPVIGFWKVGRSLGNSLPEWSGASGARNDSRSFAKSRLFSEGWPKITHLLHRYRCLRLSRGWEIASIAALIHPPYVR